MRDLSVREAARRLGLSEQRVRALLQTGRLKGHKVGWTWVVHADSALGRSRPQGRPLSALNAWGLLALLAGDRVKWLDPSIRSRLRRRIRDQEIVRVLRESEPRSQVYRWRVLRGDLEKLASDFPLVPSGLTAGYPDLDLVSVGEELDAYVDEKQVDKIERRFRPDRSEDQPNLILRVPSHPWILSFNRAPLPVVAADLLENDDPRVARAAARILKGGLGID
jgi:excisionase family DNA binding protein